jgi:hypothetical protein
VSDVDALLGMASPPAPTPARPLEKAPATPHPLQGVHGWLKFGVVVNLFVAPILFVLSQLVAWVGYFIIANRYPGIFISGLYGTAAGGYLIWRGMNLARDFRALKPRSVQNAKTLLWLNVLFVAVSIPLVFFSGMGPDALMPGVLMAVFRTAASFAVIYTYLNVSKRIAVNFPDWKDP